MNENPFWNDVLELVEANTLDRDDRNYILSVGSRIGAERHGSANGKAYYGWQLSPTAVKVFPDLPENGSVWLEANPNDGHSDWFSMPETIADAAERLHTAGRPAR